MGGGTMIAPLIGGGYILGIVATMSVFLLILRRAARHVARADIAMWRARIEEEWREESR